MNKNTPKLSYKEKRTKFLNSFEKFRREVESKTPQQAKEAKRVLDRNFQTVKGLLPVLTFMESILIRYSVESKEATDNKEMLDKFLRGANTAITSHLEYKYKEWN